MFYKWSKQYKRLELKRQLEDKKYFMKEVRGEMALYAQANDEVSKAMYQELLAKSLKDIDERNKMQQELDKPEEAIEEQYKKDIAEITKMTDEVIEKESYIEQARKTAENIKEQLEAKKQEKEDKALALEVLIDVQLEQHKEFTDEDIVNQDKLNKEIKMLEGEILGLEDLHKSILGDISVKQMAIAQTRKKAMEQIFRVTAKYNYKMQMLGEEKQLPTDAQYRAHVFDTMTKIRKRTNQEKDEEKNRVEEEKQRKQKEDEKAKGESQKGNNRTEGQDGKQKGTTEPTYPNTPRPTPPEPTGSNPPAPTPPEPKKGLFARIKDWWSRKKEKRITDGKENKPQEVDENTLSEDVVFQETNYYDKEGKVVDGFYVSYYKEEDKDFVPKVNVDEHKAQADAEANAREEEQEETR